MVQYLNRGQCPKLMLKQILNELFRVAFPMPVKQAHRCNPDNKMQEILHSK